MVGLGIGVYSRVLRPQNPVCHHGGEDPNQRCKNSRDALKSAIPRPMISQLGLLSAFSFTILVRRAMFGMPRALVAISTHTPQPPFGGRRPFGSRCGAPIRAVPPFGGVGGSKKHVLEGKLVHFHGVSGLTKASWGEGGGGKNRVWHHR